MGAENRRGQQHLRVGIEFGPDGVRVDRLWLVDQPAVQSGRLAGPLLVRVETGGRTALVQSFPDPRVTRSTASDERGHHYGVADSGNLIVSVPFTSAAELADVRVSLADTSDMGEKPTAPHEASALFEARPRGMGRVREFSTADLRRSRDWDQVAAQLGLAGEQGVFQIYQDAEGCYRWRFLRDAEIVADSGQGYDRRADCEADLQWLREHAADAAVTVDRPPGPP
jgi:uncharacterized protein YegP (UPF0339 family)